MVGPRALGRGDVNPVKGEQPLEFSLDRIFPPLRDSNVLEANNRGPLLENPMYFLFTPLVSVWAYVPCYCSFHCVGGNRASPPKVHEPFGWKSLVGSLLSVFVALNSSQRFHPVRIGARRSCCFLAYDPANPNIFSVNEPGSIMSLLSRLRIQEPTFVFRARKNSNINFQDRLGT